MSDNGATAFPTQLAVTCGFCGDSNDVTWFCKSCAGSLCNKCKISHPTIPMFRNHVVVPRTNDVMRLYGPSKIAEHCQIHPEKEILTYCNNCQVPCCVTCLVQNHKSHDISTIEDKYLSTENFLNNSAKELEKEVMPALDRMADKVKDDRSERRDQIDRAKKEVNTFRNELKQVVDDSCDDLIEKLDQNDIEFDSLIANIDAKKKQVRELIKEINEIIQKGDLSMIKYSPPSLGDLIPEVPTLKITFPVFTPGREILTNIKEKMGTVDWIDRSSESDYTQSLTTIFNPSMISISIVSFFESKIAVTSITSAGNNTAWLTHNCSDTMYLYDSNGKVVRSITVKGSYGIYDMVIRRSGEIIVTCGDRKIRRVSVSGEVSKLIDTSPFFPESVCLTDSEDVVVCLIDRENFVVCMNRRQDERSHLAVYSPDTGVKLREIRGIDGQGKQQITNPYRVVYNGKDLCVVNDCHYSKVVCVDERGDVRWVYVGMRAKQDLPFGSSGISVDKYNNILVTDTYNRCVHYIDHEGRLITQEEIDLYPTEICVDNNAGQVWIGNSSKNVVICKYNTYHHK